MRSKKELMDIAIDAIEELFYTYSPDGDDVILLSWVEVFADDLLYATGQVESGFQP